MADMPDSGSEEFARRMFRMWNEAGLALMVSLGHRTGLFDVMARLPPSTSAEIAASAGLNERYVREWLAAMSTGRIADYRALIARPIRCPRIALRGSQDPQD